MHVYNPVEVALQTGKKSLVIKPHLMLPAQVPKLDCVQLHWCEAQCSESQIDVGSYADAL